MHNCSIIIPTQDRPKLLLRCIKYYEDKSFNKKKIIILDSSKKKFTYKFKRNFSYFYKKNEKFNTKILFGIKNSKTKYVILCNDDDFISNHGLNKGLNFLEKNKKYSSIQGEFIFFRKLIKLDVMTFVEAYSDTLKYNLNFKNNFGIDRAESIYLKRPHWYNALHYRRNLETSFSIASKGTDLHFSELIIPLIIGIQGYVKTAKFFWYAKDSNVYKDLSIVEQKKRMKMLKEILSNKTPIRKAINKFIFKTSKNHIRDEAKFNYMIEKYFIKYLLKSNHNSNLLISNKIKYYLHQSLPTFIKNLLRISINYIKNNSIENTSFKKKYGPTNDRSSFNNWLLMKLHVKDFDKKYNYNNIYKNLK
jgi:glycosyltransferase domain-containing protein